MTIAEELAARAGGLCELCGAGDAGDVYGVPQSVEDAASTNVLLCGKCRTEVEAGADLDVHHWRCLSETMWSQEPAVQVMAFRMLNRLRGEDWAPALLDVMYMEDKVRSWAERGLYDGGGGADGGSDDDATRHTDSNGVELSAGDAVTLIKDLNVKGSSLIAKRGTVVRNIRLVANNAAHIEGRVDGQLIVILTEFVKKSG